MEAQFTEDHYRVFFEHVGTATIVMGADRRIILANRQAEILSGYRVCDLIGMSWTSFILPEDLDLLLGYDRAREAGEAAPPEYETRIRVRGGEVKHVLARIERLPERGNTIVSLIDITSLKNTQKALTQSEEKFRTLIENSFEVFMIISRDRKIRYESQSVTRLFGYPVESVIGVDPFIAIHPRDRDQLAEVLRCLCDGTDKVRYVRFRHRHRNGTWRSVEAVANSMLDDPVISGIVVNLRDVTDQLRAEERAWFYENHDPLTGLVNKDYLQGRIETEIKRAEQRKKLFAVMCLGIDKLKSINGMYGMTAGNEVIIEMGSRLVQTYRDYDLVGRYTGDKFMVLLGDMKSPDDLLRIVQKTFSSLVAPFRIQGKEIPITVSIGFCMYPYDGTNAEELVAHSEEAMDHAKDLGRNTYSLYNERMNREALLRIKVEQELTKALKADEFLIHYQPKVDRFGRLQGMEALARSNSPVLGSVPPPVFIPVAERCGLIIPLGDLVLKKVCAQILEWGRLGHDFGRIAVNLSPFQLSRPGLVPSILETLRTHRISPERMEFEITETGLMENEGEGIERINQLTKLGFLVSVDDFGTGYSNLSKLKSYPIHTLKIDKSFIDDIPGNPYSASISHTIIDLGHNLGCKIVAEGVEKESQFDFLVRSGCDYFQGFLFHQPMPAEEIPDRLAASVKQLSPTVP